MVWRNRLNLFDSISFPCSFHVPTFPFRGWILSLRQKRLTCTINKAIASKIHDVDSHFLLSPNYAIHKPSTEAIDRRIYFPAKIVRSCCLHLRIWNPVRSSIYCQLCSLVVVQKILKTATNSQASPAWAESFRRVSFWRQGFFISFAWLARNSVVNWTAIMILS